MSARNPDYSSLLEAWQQMRGRCSGSGVYEARLAFIYLLQKEPDRAIDVLRHAPVPQAPYSSLVDAARIQAEFDQALAGKNVTSTMLERFAPRFARLIEDAPSWYVAHELNATYWLTRGEPRRAIDHASRAVELEPTSWWGYRTMSIAYSDLGDHATAAAMADKAHALHPAVSADADMMLALARSYGALGNRKMSETILSLLLTYRPALRETPQYRETISFIHEATGGETPK